LKPTLQALQSEVEKFDPSHYDRVSSNTFRKPLDAFKNKLEEYNDNELAEFLKLMASV
jgi:hypothetical protein